MAQKLVECVPNFSEGRRTEVVDAIGDAISAVSGVQLLDRQSDSDHNRTVVTFAGGPDAVSEAAFAGIATAAKLIDMDVHRGEHPRLGATDVVPFVPISGVTMADCVELARALGRRVGDELGIPVYLYEAAATRPERVNLADVRRGEYEALKAAIATDPNRVPDFGPTELGKAGATVIGARAPLIAYNIYLTTDDVGVAKKIARATRHSSGGLHYVKALGLLVEGRAQVSINLTDYTQTPVARVVEMVRREAARYGVNIHHSELVGLIPQAALIDAAQWYLQLDQFQPDQVLETRLLSAASGHQELADTSFVERLAAGTATPGGGSAAAYSGAMAAALAAMVARLTVGKKKYTEVEDRMRAIAMQADELRAALEKSVTLDAQAFDRVMAAFQMPKDSDAEKAGRAAAIESATHRAAEVPLEVMRQVVSVLELLAEVAETGNSNAVTDATSGMALAHAAFAAAGLNIRANAASVSDKDAAQRWLDDLSELEAQAQQAENRVRAALKERVGLDLL
jgi:glutamate formiminotransferase / formiminotetrahydrofolate cyclodeaminase